MARGPQTIGNVLQDVIQDLGIRREIDAARTIEAWAAVAGPRINGVTSSAWVKGTTLYVRITSAAWRHELHLSRRAWRDRLNEHLGGNLVDQVVFR